MTERLANPFQFLDVERQDPNKRSMESRTEEFVEIYDPFTEETAAEQSHRCLECGNPTVSGNALFTTSFLTGSSCCQRGDYSRRLN